MRPLDAAYAPPNTLRWLWLAYCAARRLHAPLWAVLTGSWGRSFPRPVDHLTNATGWVCPQEDTALRAFLAAHYAYCAAHDSAPPQSAAQWGFLARVRDHLVLWPADEQRLADLVAELFAP